MAIFILLAVGVLYLTIWPHELGHSSVAYLFGCKANWWQTDMSWFLWNSRGGQIDYGCLRARGGAALGLTDFAGIIVNLAFLALAPLVGRWWRTDLRSNGSRWEWVFLTTFLWALANYAEAFSYLVLNTILLKSDMETVVIVSGISRWVWLGAGFLLAVLIGRLLRQPALRAAVVLAAPRGSTRAWLRAFVLYVVVVSGAMGAARIILT